MKLNHPANREIVKYLEEHRQLEVHSDLRHWLTELASHLTGQATLKRVNRVTVLIHPERIIFALAHGMDRLVLRLPEPLRLKAINTGARKTSIGEEWIEFDPWALHQRDLAQWCQAAYEYAGALAQEKS